jgi:hypothetical protein
MQVVCSAEADIDHLFEMGGPSEYDKHHARVMAGDLDIAVVSFFFHQSHIVQVIIRLRMEVGSRW